MATLVSDAPAFFSACAADFHASYATDANRQERLRVWNMFLDRYLTEAGFAYDLGCGSGILACELGRRGVQTVGVDGAPGMLAIAQRSAAEAGLDNVQFTAGMLPIPDPERWRPADAVIASSALEYLASLPDALRSIWSMLRPGGVLVFSVSNRDSVSRWIVRAIHRLTGRPVYFGLLKQFCTPDSLRRELEAAGFTPLDHVHFARADRINRLLGRVLPARFASNMVIVAARRS